MSTLIQDVQALLATMAPAGGVSYAINTAQPPVYPFVVWQRVVSVASVSLGGPSALQNTRIQVDLYSRDVQQLEAMGNQLEAIMAAAPITNVPLGSQDEFDVETRTWRSIKEFSVWASN